MTDAAIARATGIDDSTYHTNKGKAHFADFQSALREGRATGAALVLGADFEAAISKTDPIRSQARDRYYKHSGDLIRPKEKELEGVLQVTGDVDLTVNDLLRQSIKGALKTHRGKGR